MNNRIVRLIDQMDQSGIPYQAGDNLMTITDRYLAKFAELIVRECVGIVEQYGTPDAFYIVDEINRVMLNIRPDKHFGVEK